MKTFKQFLEGKEFREKHTKDQKHGKNGYVGGNPRYSDSKKPACQLPDAKNSRNAAKNVDEE